MTRQDDTRDLTSIGLLILRLGMGLFLATHGWGKLQMLRAGDFASFGDPIGLGAVPSLVLVTFAEFLCALLVAAGLGTRFAAVPVVVTMGVAAFVAHGSDPWTSQAAAMNFFAGTAEHWGAKEPALVFLSGFLALIFTGAGRYSLDAWLRRRRATRGGSYASA